MCRCRHNQRRRCFEYSATIGHQCARNDQFQLAVQKDLYVYGGEYNKLGMDLFSKYHNRQCFWRVAGRKNPC